MDFLKEGRYDLFILDSAPTGHLLRLLELPELIDQWLKTFFGLLLKYNLTFRFPDLSQQLVRISRDLKLLIKLWRDPVRAALYAITILTEMAFQETSDLLAVCGCLGVPVPLLFLNLATPAWDCPLCAALNRREGLIKDKFRHTFAGHQTIIYRQSEPRGLKRLGELGQALYRANATENHHGAVTDMPALAS
jgi:arsenite-transporting ATPase